jgi:aryl-alcohol dehydrogenase-like predicted oxidoreductase
MRLAFRVIPWIPWIPWQKDQEQILRRFAPQDDSGAPLVRMTSESGYNEAMNQRSFGRTGWRVGEVGYGMWGLASWTESDDAESFAALQLAVDLGCNFFDTAAAYGEGRSERMLGQVIRANPGRMLYAATKIPPKNRKWPARPEYPLDEVFPPDHIRASTERSLGNLGVDRIDLLQFHVWDDSWADDDRWQRAMDDLKREGLIRAIGVSINRWEPWNSIRTLRTGRVDSVQVIYNIFDQAPEDELFPLCRELGVAVIARVPFDEGSLTGTLTRGSRWPDGDWRNMYFGPENLPATLDRVERLQPLVPEGSTLPEMALRFILSNPDVSVVIPGMRKPAHVRANFVKATDAGPLSPQMIERLREHRWDRTPASWSA